MTIQDVIDAVLRYHPHLEGYRGCDEFKCGNPADECTGIAVAMSPTIHVVEQAIRQHCNLIIVHEPTNYTSLDRPGWQEDFPNEVYARKQALLQEHGIAIWRDHDHMHAHNPDGIFTGVLRYMGWEDYAVPDPSMKMFMHFIVTLPAPQPLGRILAQLQKTIGLNGIRYIGDEAMMIRKLAIVGHLNTRPEPGAGAEVNHHGDLKEYSVEIMRYYEEQGIDLVLPGETIDWTLPAYVRDAVQLGQNKALITLGHFNWEELGMRYTADWLPEVTGGKLPVCYIPSEDMYHYFI